MLKKFGRSKLVQTFAGSVLANYLRLVWWTSRATWDKMPPYKMPPEHQPYILAMWHGQHFLGPFFRPKDEIFNVLISRHGDGNINALAAEKLGLHTIRGSGDTRRRGNRKGGTTGFLKMLSALENGECVALTADVPKGPARRAGMGIVQLAAKSGRPIVPVAFASSRRKDLNSWDKASVNLPFSRLGITIGEPIYVPADLSEEDNEAYRLQIEDSLNDATERVYAKVDR